MGATVHWTAAVDVDARSCVVTTGGENPADLAQAIAAGVKYAVYYKGIYPDARVYVRVYGHCARCTGEGRIWIRHKRVPATRKRCPDCRGVDPSPWTFDAPLRFEYCDDMRENARKALGG